MPAVTKPAHQHIVDKIDMLYQIMGRTGTVMSTGTIYALIKVYEHQLQRLGYIYVPPYTAPAGPDVGVIDVTPKQLTPEELYDRAMRGM